MTPKKITLPSGDIRYEIRYRDQAGNAARRRFRLRGEAVQAEAAATVDVASGSYVDPRLRRQTFAAVAERHWSSYHHTLAEDTTRPRKRSMLDRHILPALGHLPIGGIRPSTVKAAVATWSGALAPGTVAQVLRQVRQVLDYAVEDGLISSNPAKAAAVRAPAVPRRRDVHLEDTDVVALIAAASEDWQPLVIVLAGLGLRISEACGLSVANVDFLRRVVRVRQQRRPGGDLGRLKTDSSQREVPASDLVLQALAEQLRLRPRLDGLVFSSASGGPLTKSSAGHYFDRLELATGLEVSPHSLRHYFGASLIARGVNVVAVSRWLGHSSPEITWRVYSYMMRSDEDAGRAAMQAIARQLVGESVTSVSPRGLARSESL